MALIQCNECHKEISDKAKRCPHCGCPLHFVRGSKFAKWTIAVCSFVLVISGIVYYRYEKAQVKVAIKQHNEHIQQMASKQPKKPNSYAELENILQHYNPTSPACRLDLYDALNNDRKKGTPFKETKIYKDWDNYYKVNLTPIF